jgi:8-oxo-dGTP pyrophosphatase MutT (NUDIX family)
MDLALPTKTNAGILKEGRMSGQVIKDAATVILMRDAATSPKVLMGQRGATAAFMPNKFVFPGGAVDIADASVDIAGPISEPCNSRLKNSDSAVSPHAIYAAAIRELWEESGLILGKPGNWSKAPVESWETFCATGHVPSAQGMYFVARAITPAGRPRRFDARFFLVDASAVSGDLDDFQYATDELSHLQWVNIDQAATFDLPFITSVVLAEVAATLPNISAPDSVPFFNNSDERSLFERLGGESPLNKQHQ